MALAVLSHAVPTRADDDETPILLTNADVDRMRGQTASADRASAPDPADGVDLSDTGLVLTHRSGDWALWEEAEPEAPAAAPASPPDSQPLAGSWQEEYYRLKALALRQALERGETIDFSDGDAGPPAAAASAGGPEAPPSRPLSEREPACMYDARGTLIHQPDGGHCSERRVRSAPRPGLSRHDSCMYDRRGEVIHAPNGIDCDRD
jgi:hypothetical protein